jgi:hypothetical protein
VRDRQPQLYDELEDMVLPVSPTLARVEGCAILTLDADFRRVDVPVIVPG